jgi:hypothetical protein
MQHEVLQAVIGTAVIDPRFRKALLNGSRRRILAPFELSREEFDAVMAVRADSLEQFASQLDDWLCKTQNVIDPPSLAFHRQSPLFSKAI